MYDIITFGSAIRDFFLPMEKDFCLPLDEKIFLNDFLTASGGGGTNTAATFTKQGLRTAYCGKVGNDIEGLEIIKELKKCGVGVSLIKKDKERRTTISVIFSFPQKRQRAIFFCKGASLFFNKKDVDWQKIKQAKWFYFSPFHGDSLKIFPELIDFAFKNKIKIAVNPSKEQLAQKELLLKDLKKVDLLILNKNESFLLTGEKDEKKCLKKLLSFGPKIAIITKGSDGAIVSDDKYVYETAAPNVVIKETTGAGDAYGSGFLSGLLQKNDMEFANKLAMANSSSCIQEVGAKNGLLKKGERKLFDKIKVKKSLI